MSGSDEPASTSEAPDPPSSDPSERTPLVPKYVTETEDSTGGLSVKQTTFLIVGEMAGSGVLALPRALTKTGWIGVPIIIGMCAVAAVSGKRLGYCWTILEEGYPELRGRRRNPYAIIADKALGSTWRVVVSMSITATLFGATVVYLLMAAQIVEEVLAFLIPSVNYCLWYLVMVAVVTPFTLFNTPKDFPLTGVVAFGATVVACILYLVQMMFDIRRSTYRYGLHGFQQFFLAFGTIMFAFGGASAFPTIQNDMADKTKYNKSLRYSFLAILGLYLPIAIAGYAVYGESVSPNVATSLSPGPVALAGNVLMAVHLVSASVILINPVCQEAEELYGLTTECRSRRTLLRVAIMLGVLFVGETIPRFHTILSLLGATTVALLAFILPSYCYMKLVKQLPSEQQSKWPTTGCWEVITLGVVGGVAATLCAIGALVNSSRTLPCYFR